MPLMTVSTAVITVLHYAEVVHIPHESRSTLIVGYPLGGGLVGRLGLLGRSGPKGQMGRLATGPIGPNVEENIFSDKKLNFLI
jgi:hypothetical protein